VSVITSSETVKKKKQFISPMQDKNNHSSNYKCDDNRNNAYSGSKLDHRWKAVYQGFVEIQEDLYAKADNPSFLLNEAGVNTFANSYLVS